jgi:hypothetical protein
METQAADGRPPEALRRVRQIYLAVIAAHERVAELLIGLGDQEGACEERQAAKQVRARLARVDARLAADE